MRPPNPPPPKATHHGCRQAAGRITDEQFEIGQFALRASGRVRLSPRRTLGIRRALSQHTRKQGSLWLHAATATTYHNGQVLFELEGMKPATARAAYRAIRNKLPMSLRLEQRATP